MNTYIKISEYEIEAIKEQPIPVPIKTTHQRDFIEKQILAITKQRDEMIALKEAELKECEEIILEMDKLGIVVKPIEPIEEQLEPLEIIK